MPLDAIHRYLRGRKLKPVPTPVPHGDAHTPTSHAPIPRKTKRQQIVLWAHWGVLHEPAIGYTMGAGRDDWLTNEPHKKLPTSTDCSGFATFCYFMAGARDPNGFNYRALGYTGTLLKHGKRIGIGHVRPGDLAVFGCKTYPNGHHVVVVTEVHEPTLKGIVSVSHGQARGPFEITIAEEAKYQPDGPAGIVFLSFVP